VPLVDLGLGEHGHLGIVPLLLGGVSDIARPQVADRNALQDVGESAIVIRVKVRDQHVVDLLDPCGVAGLLDPIGIAVAGVARIDQHRFTSRRDHQDRRAAFHVDPIDVEALVSGAGMLPGPAPEEKHRQHGS